jgi:dTDP-4-amino-4,6-dideoxygalactose transaminase
MVTPTTLAAWPVFETDELTAVDAVLRSGRVNYWTGTACRDFEQAWSDAHTGTHCLSMANGSLTMDAALHVLGVGPGDEVIVSPRSYVASAMCVALCGATPVFADVDLESGCITADTAEAVRSPRTKAIIPVHIGGWPCDMTRLCEWAGRHGIQIIEDCAQSHGGHIDGRPLGTFGAFASWSFCQDKIMTTGGEGGMLATPDKDFWKKAWAYCQHGKDCDRSLTPPPAGSTPGFRWLVDHAGTNLRMTEMQAAIGLRQLAKLQSWSAARRRNSLIMQEALRTVPGLRVPETPAGHAHYRCVAFTTGDHAGQLRDHLIDCLNAARIPAMHGSCSEIYRERFFEEHAFTPRHAGHGRLDGDGRLPYARALGETSLTFLVHHTIDADSMRRYANATVNCLLKALHAQTL